MQQHFTLFYECSGISTDTRTISPGDLFICLKGDRYDANEFAEQALSQGAKYVISSDPSRCNTVNILYVDDTLDFLQALANHHRKQFNIPILGITGSNEKPLPKSL